MSGYLPYMGLCELQEKMLLVRCLLAEFLGVMFLVLVGCGSCLGADGDADLVRISLAFGVTVATLAQSIGHISGCHINPAVTAGLFFGRKIGLYKALLYVACQCLGGIVGSGLLQAVGTEDIQGYAGLGMTSVNPKIAPEQGLAIEFLITFVLVLVVFASAADEDNAPNVKGSAPLAIGLSITTCHLFAIPFTGSSMNPARTFGPAVILGAWDNHWVYWVGPILGGISASLVYQVFFKAPLRDAASKEEEYLEVCTKEEQKQQQEEEGGGGGEA